MAVGEIVTVMTTNGEYVGKIKEISLDGSSLTLSDPRLIVMQEQGMGFANGIAMTGIEQPKEVTFKNYTFFTQTDQAVVDAWNEHTGQIIMPKKNVSII